MIKGDIHDKLFTAIGGRSDGNGVY